MLAKEAKRLKLLHFLHGTRQAEGEEMMCLECGVVTCEVCAGEGGWCARCTDQWLREMNERHERERDYQEEAQEAAADRKMAHEQERRNAEYWKG